MFSQSRNKCSNGVDIIDNTLNDIIETITTTGVIQRWYKHHVWCLKFQFRLKDWQSVGLRIGILEDVIERGMDGVEETIDYHVVEVVNIGTPYVGCRTRFEKLQVLLRTKRERTKEGYP